MKKTIVFAVVLAVALILLILSQVDRAPAATMTFVDNAAEGTLTVMDGALPVLTYRSGDQLPAGLDAKQARSCYIHPLYSLDGEVLTADFPADHLHHHGVFWTWPSVEVRGVATQTWHPAEPSLRQHFVRWVERRPEDGGAVLAVETVWKLAEKEVVAKETVTLKVHPTDGGSRAIDVEIVLVPLGGSMKLRGATDANKGYGGLTFRGAPLLKGAPLTTDEGVLKEDSTGRPFRWADVSTAELGVAIFVPPGHPAFPLDWLARNSYAGVLNPCWPGLVGTTLEADVPVTLRYRIYVHRGDAVAGRVKEAYDAYISSRQL